MPAVTNISITEITRVLLKDDGWIEIVPGSFSFTSLNFYFPPTEESGWEPQFSGLSYLGFKFIDNVSQKHYYVPTDGVGAIETIPTPPVDPPEDPEDPENPEGGE